MTVNRSKTELRSSLHEVKQTGSDVLMADWLLEHGDDLIEIAEAAQAYCDLPGILADPNDVILAKFRLRNAVLVAHKGNKTV